MANSQSSDLLRTPLFDLAQEQQARFTAFSGWEMPVQYSGLKLEHQAVRSGVGMFDISHMGKFTFVGEDLIDTWQALVPSDLSRLEPGQAQYTVLLNPQGGIIDDIIFYYQGEQATTQQAFVIVNAGTTDKDKDWIISHLQNNSITMADISRQQALIALQGPKSTEVLQALIKEDLTTMAAFTHKSVNINGQSAFIARTGYTGEDGFEIMSEPDAARQLWQNFLEVGVTPCGLGARDTLRLEAAMSLYGQEIDETTTPLEAGLGWLVHLNTKGDFIGRSVLEQQKTEGIKRRLVGLEMSGRYIARHGYRVMFEGQPVGEVTSGTLAPTVGKAIALAYVPKHLSKLGQSLEIEIRDKTYPATVVKKPFYRSPHK
ncbi:glycine cleavage system aminomethyltransferase GcvT [Pleurocapsa sp. PCC 7319]|uniref:glycine cleavage system aminomethyltransferase GcvT n=1 Tax=Pleurocapsa sp. PCC 7319 TaxID=118161 RepID=UPI00034B6DFC|nr:glycine cleavage system aminomethyltransferase GcvT [Pleurocapsa sp. PCC 7319]